MKERALGTATVSAVGCGDVRLALAAARGLDARGVERALVESFTFGVTLVDIADETDAERLVGDVVKTMRLRDRVTTAVRVPVVAPRPGIPHRDVLPEQLPVLYVQERIEASLRNTRLDALPLAQLPVKAAWRASSAWPELVGTCARLVHEGKVLQWGAIIEELDGAPDLAAEPWLASLQVTYNLCERDAEPVLAAAAKAKLAILARRPLAGGALAGQLGPGVRFTPRDDRNAIDDATLERMAVLAARLSPLVRHEPPAARSCPPARAALERGRRPPEVECSTLAELALRFVIDRDAIALPRLHRAEHVTDTVIAASAPPLSAALRERLDDLLRS